MSLAILLHALAAVTPAGSPDHQICREMTMSVPAGAILDADNTRTVICADTVETGKVAYDRRVGVVRARISLTQDEPIGRVWLPLKPRVLPGDKLMLTARIGATTVSRDVTALQSAADGHRFFVIDADGQVFAAPSLATSEN
ncbi:hypothetical protein [Sphingomonas colocasiae]|uniref:Flagella basal body P-ring formation protein FlgA C-terminal domain-containing protein n=1 Tax=Sphingomonas colocasiae TaxID=1848973 RepID=A0ABS7PW12_9SPHN|nr:hypothetical protein [Sphingomonas colocasiae]MBY8825552.1 hypothetical protein [Sphingomonas colocasiae]